MITSLLQMYDEGGWIPMWPNPTYPNIMLSTHADSVIADAYVRDSEVSISIRLTRRRTRMP